MNERRPLAREAVRRALALRRSHAIGPNRPVQIYDLVDELGIELRFLDAPSMEGLYHREAPSVIVVSSLRPRGRRAFTTAHELGHHVFGHGTRVDELTAQQQTAGPFRPEEYLADTFASALLMPRAAVDWAFGTRGWTPADCTPVQLYTVACWLDVGFETLVYQLGTSLNALSRARMQQLLRANPKRIRTDVLGFDHDGDVVVADGHWRDRAIDLEVGDLAVVPADIVLEGECAEVFGADGDRTLLRAAASGRGRAAARDGEWSAYVRVSRRGYVGRSIFRHLEDPEDPADG
jgi:Zn-dependent peptidase ImmA (M78 family)